MLEEVIEADIAEAVGEIERANRGNQGKKDKQTRSSGCVPSST